MFCQLLVEHSDVIAPDRHDPLHELLDDLGDVPDVDFLIGIVSVCILLDELLESCQHVRNVDVTVTPSVVMLSTW